MKSKRSLILLFVVMLVAASPPAFSQVRLYDWANCSGDYIEVGHEQHANLANLTWPGGGSVDQDVSSVWIPFWDPDWEIYACDFTNFNGGCSKQFNLDDEIGWGCINMSGIGWDPDELPPNQDITSIIVQPSTHTRYFEEHGYKERVSDPGGGRAGYIEVWTEAGFEGMNYKAYGGDTNWSNNPPKHIESIRVYGEITVQLCTSGYGTCTSYSAIRLREIEDLYGEGYLDPNDEVTGIRVYSAGAGSVFALSASDSVNECKYFAYWMADTTGEVGPESKKSYWNTWSEDYGNYTWPGTCFDQCSSNGDDGCPGAPCDQVCADAIREYMGMLTYEDRQWAADASMTILDAHGAFFNPEGEDAYTLLKVMHRNIAHCNHDGNEHIKASSWYSHDRPGWAAVLPDQNHEYGDWNTDWMLLLACKSMEDIVNHPEILGWQVYSLLLESGVHGIGGFDGSPIMISRGAGETQGKERAIEFWDALETLPVSRAWLETMGDLTLGETEYDRDPGYITGEDCDCEEPACNSRMLSDYYIGKQTGPMPDIQGNDVTWRCAMHDVD